jgi:hypothetical protein
MQDHAGVGVFKFRDNVLTGSFEYYVEHPISKYKANCSGRKKYFSLHFLHIHLAKNGFRQRNVYLAIHTSYFLGLYKVYILKIYKQLTSYKVGAVLHQY